MTDLTYCNDTEKYTIDMLKDRNADSAMHIVRNPWGWPKKSIIEAGRILADKCENREYS